MTKEAKDIVDNGAQPDNLDATLQELNEEMNRSISVEEIETSLKKLKNGKASGLDTITNEALKASPPSLKNALVKLFNECLDKGIYPWNRTVISPLHKKGDINNPDNYRAIAVGSNMGKLFSSILLQRLFALTLQTLSLPGY